MKELVFRHLTHMFPVITSQVRILIVFRVQHMSTGVLWRRSSWHAAGIMPRSAHGPFVGHVRHRKLTGNVGGHLKRQRSGC